MLNPRLRFVVYSPVWNEVDVKIEYVRCMSVVDGYVTQVVDRIEHLTT
jgi:hypothetical protein